MEFKYKAVTSAGENHHGTVSADSRPAAISELRNRGLYATELNERKRVHLRNHLAADGFWQMEIHFGPKVKSDEFAIFSRQLATLISAGVPIADAVRVLSEQTENRTFARALYDVTSELEQGSLFSQAAAQREDIFPGMFVSMLRAAEVSGNLDDVLERMAVFFEKEHHTREKVKSAMTYPAVVCVMAICVTTFLMMKVVPTFVGVFQNFGATLPLPTRVVLGVSHFTVAYWYLVLFPLIGLIVGYQLALGHPVGRRCRDTMLLKLPVFGELLTKSAMSRMARTMSSLFATAVPVLQSLELTADVVNNAVVSKALNDCRESLSAGQSLSEPLSNMWVFPPLLVHMIRVGEETGNLDFMLTKIADFYEAETEVMVDRLKSLLEPFMILFLAGIVGIIVLSILMPMFSIYNQVGSMS